MSAGLRIYLFDDDGNLNRLSLKRYLSLMNLNRDESLPQYAGKRIRYAEVALEYKNRKPVEVLRLQYFVMYFNQNGQLDVSELERAHRLSSVMSPPIGDWPEGKDPVVIDASHRFAKKHYDHRYRWEPTPEDEKALMIKIFGDLK